MALRRYTVTLNGVETELKLSDEAAERMGLRTADDPKPVPNKARTTAPTKARAPRKPRAKK